MRIAAVKRTLAAEKRKFGGYDDSRGLRYLPPQYFIKLEDFTGGLTYLKWFDKNFSDDIGFPDFLFEWTVILFKKGLLEQAEKKAFKTFCSNIYLFDKFFGRQIIPVQNGKWLNLADPAYAGYFIYSSEQSALSDFSDWLNTFIRTAKFTGLSARYLDISKELLTERDFDARRRLLNQISALADSL